MTRAKKKRSVLKEAVPPPPQRTPVQEIALEEQIVGAPLLGKVKSYDTKSRAMSLILEEALMLGDGLRVKGRQTDLAQRVERLRVGGRVVQSALPGEVATVEVADRVHAGDAVYKVPIA